GTGARVIRSTRMRPEPRPRPRLMSRLTATGTRPDAMRRLSNPPPRARGMLGGPTPPPEGEASVPPPPPAFYGFPLGRPLPEIQASHLTVTKRTDADSS